jgi:hypothetical protein
MMVSEPPVEPVQGALQLDTIQENGLSVYKVTLPYLPPSKNVFDNWPPAWRNGAKKKWLKAIARAADEQMMPRGIPRVGLAATLVFSGMTIRTSNGQQTYVRSAPRRDPQNFAQCLWNFVPDALVRCGVLIDDNEGRVQIGPNWGLRLLVDDRAAPKAKVERTVLTIAMEHAKPVEVIRP